ncbi:MAG: thioredoxin family protein [Pontixanthobacter sp.]
MKSLWLAPFVMLISGGVCAHDVGGAPKPATDSATGMLVMQENTAQDDRADPDHPEARAYDAAIDVDAALADAFARARGNGTRVVVAMGANWCHDSRAFAGWMEMPRFQQLLTAQFELVYINVGMPQTDDGHNLHIAERHGITVEGTPTILILDADGTLLNTDSAGRWRNAASREENAIYEELSSYATGTAG